MVVNGESLSASKLNEMKDNDVVVNNEAEQHCEKKRSAAMKLYLGGGYNNKADDSAK